MQRVRLTVDRISTFQCPPEKAQAFLWDTEAPRLAVRATKGTANKGTKSYVFESKLNRQTVRLTIGDVRTWALDEARTEARRLQTLADRGIDPRQEKAERMAESAHKRETARRTEAPALDAWDAYLSARVPRWSARTLLDHQRASAAGGAPKSRGRKSAEDTVTQRGILRPLLALPLARIDADAVRLWLKDEAATRPTQARLAFGNLRTFLNWCADRPEYKAQVHPDACAARASRDELPPKAAKDDCLQREMLRPWFTEVRKLPSPVQSVYLQALLLTGARRGELASLRWEQVDFRWKMLTIRDKVEGERVIPLTPYVSALLLDLKRRQDSLPSPIRKDATAGARSPDGHASPWVFSSRTAASGRLQEPRIPHNKALAAAGLPALSLHGLRRSFGTLAEWVEVPAGISAQIMGHKPSAIAEKHYRRRPIDMLREWHTKIEGWTLAEAGIEQPTEQEAAPALRVVA
jgi:integrase